MEQKPIIEKQDRQTIKTGIVAVAIIIGITIFFGIITNLYSPNDRTLKLSNYTAPTEDELNLCTCQEVCLLQKETEYCVNHDCEIYEINVPPCLGQTMVVRKSTRQQITYIVPPYDYTQCYAKCKNINLTILMP